MQKSRQVQRAEFRAEVKTGERRRKIRARAERQLALEKRKSAPSALRMAATSKSRSRLDDRKILKGQPFGRIIRTIVEQPEGAAWAREFTLHAAKGWRSHRA